MRAKTIFKWLLAALGGVVALAVLACVVIYIIIGLDLSRTFEVEGTIVDVPTDSLSIAEGERLARLRGCNGGCHGESVYGEIFFEVFDGTQVVAPDLARVAQAYSTAEPERAVRHGIRSDGTSVMDIMPSLMFYGLSNEDLGAIFAFLRSQAPADTQLAARTLGPVTRVMLFYFKRKCHAKIHGCHCAGGDYRLHNQSLGRPTRNRCCHRHG